MNVIEEFLIELAKLGIDLSNEQLKNAVGCTVAQYIIGSQIDRRFAFDASEFLNSNQIIGESNNV